MRSCWRNPGTLKMPQTGFQLISHWFFFFLSLLYQVVSIHSTDSFRSGMCLPISCSLNFPNMITRLWWEHPNFRTASLKLQELFFFWPFLSWLLRHAFLDSQQWRHDRKWEEAEWQQRDVAVYCLGSKFPCNYLQCTVASKRLALKVTEFRVFNHQDRSFNLCKLLCARLLVSYLCVICASYAAL